MLRFLEIIRTYDRRAAATPGYPPRELAPGVVLPVSGYAPCETANMTVCVSARPLTVTWYAPGAMPAVSMVIVTVPLPSGPFTVSGCAAEALPTGAIVAVTASQVCPGTVEFGSANGPLVTSNCPGSGGNTPNPSSIVVPFGDLPGMYPFPVIVMELPLATTGADALMLACSFASSRRASTLGGTSWRPARLASAGTKAGA